MYGIEQAFAASPYQRAVHGACARRRGLKAHAVLRIVGDITPDAVRSALEVVICRHSALRSRLTDIGGMLAQVMEPGSSVAWGDASDAVVVAELRAERRDCELSLKISAVAVDAASFLTLARELAEVLAGSKLSDDPVQFIEFADWRNEMEPSASTRSSRDLQPSNARRSEYRVHRTMAVLDSKLTAALTQIAEKLGVDTQDCLLAAWIAYLARRSPPEMTSVRVAKDFRSSEAGLAGLVGLATAYVPLHVECDHDGTFEALTATVASSRAELREAARSIASVPSQGGIGFDVDACPSTVRAGDTRVDLIRADACAEPLAVRLTWSPATSSITLTVEREWAPLAAAERMLEGFVGFLSGLVVAGSPIAQLSAIGAKEKLWLNDAVRGPALPAFELLPMRILAAASRSPNERAVDDGTVSWSFSDLLERAHRVAAAIRPHAGRGKIVGILAEPAAPTLAAMIGVMLSGAAYVPIDPRLPPRRVSQLLGDCGASAVLAPNVRCTPPTGLPVIGLDELPSGDQRVTPHVEPDDLAYVMYTSGSTGVPKGVMVTHGGLASYAAFATSVYGFDEPVMGIVTSPFAFDLCLTTLLVPLARGRGTVIIPSSMEGLLDAIQRTPGEVVLKLTPRHLDAVTTLLPAGAAARVKTVVVGGEQLSTASVTRWQAVAPSCRLFNEYGPTETVVGCCVHEVPPGALLEGEVVPIGVPIAGSSLYVLDEHGHMLPAGAVGELYIGGAGVAQGYLGAPKLTAERFVPDPFAGAGARLFRTGDRVLRDHDGRLIFVGRRDDQLKLRGYRVEPGEIEAVLRQHPAVAACTVVRSSQSLIAFLVSAADAIEPAALERHAAEFLPEYMVPTRFVAIDRLPLTPNGKLDRAALAARLNAGEADALVALPRTEMEHLVARVWCELLGLERIDIDRRFLEAGGDSVLLIQAAARLQEQSGRPVPPPMLFEHPTVRSLAAAMSEEARPHAADLGKQRAARRAQRPSSRRRGRP